MPEVSSYEQGVPAWVDLLADDREAAMRFYAELFGWDYRVGGPESGFYTLALLRGQPVAGLGQRETGADYPVAWTTYLAVDDADATVASVVECGGEVAMAPLDVLDQGRLAVAVDPTGATVGLWQGLPGGHVGARIVDEPGALSWSELHTRQAERAGEFYAQVFGLHQERLEGQAGRDYHLLYLDRRVVGGLLQLGEDISQLPGGAPASWVTHFACADVDGTAARVRALGGAVLQEPADSTVGRLAVVQDPQGALFTLKHPGSEGRDRGFAL